MRRLLRLLDVRRWFKPPPLPQRILVADVLYLLDGGTTIVIGTDEDNRRRQMALSQHQLPKAPGKPPPAGRLYLDGWRVPVGGEAEAALLRVLDAAADEYLNRPPDPGLDGPSIAESMSRGGGAILFGGNDLRELYSLSPRQMKVKLIRDVIAYVRSGPAET
jgi:hypothetical protein